MTRSSFCVTSKLILMTILAHGFSRCMDIRILSIFYNLHVQEIGGEVEFVGDEDAEAPSELRRQT